MAERRSRKLSLRPAYEGDGGRLPRPAGRGRLMRVGSGPGSPVATAAWATRADGLPEPRGQRSCSCRLR